MAVLQTSLGRTSTGDVISAAGDNIVDDTAAVQTALDARSAAGGGEVLLGRNRTYRFTRILFVPAGCTLRGVGPATVLAPEMGIVNEGTIVDCTVTAPRQAVTNGRFEVDGSSTGSVSDSLGAQNFSGSANGPSFSGPGLWRYKWIKQDANSSVTLTPTAGRGHNGTRAIQMVNTAAGEDDFIRQFIPCLPSTTYTVTAWAEVTTFTAGAVSNRGLFVSDDATTLSASPIAGVIGLTQLTVTITTASTATQLRLALYAPQGTVYWSEVEVTGKTPAREGVAGGDVRNVTYDPATVIMRTRQPQHALPRTLAKLRQDAASSPLKVLVLGDSLVTLTAGTGVRWPSMLFDSTQRSLGYYLGDAFTNQVTISNVALSGTSGSTSHDGTAWVGMERPILDVGDGADGQILEGPVPYLPPTLSAARYDLAILGYGQNTGYASASYWERTVRLLRQSGCDVILHTSNPNDTLLDQGKQFERDARKIADGYGCALADTATAVRNGVYKWLFGRSGGLPVDDNGTNSFGYLSDGIHTATPGAKVWAQTILDCLRRNQDTPLRVDTPPAVDVVKPVGVGAEWAPVPVVKFPTNLSGAPGSGAWTLTGGCSYAATAATGAASPRNGRADLTVAGNGRIVIPATGTDYVTVSTERALSMDLLFEGNGTPTNTSTVEVSRLSDGLVLATLTCGGFSGTVSSAEITPTAWNSGVPIGRTVKIRVTAGQALWLIGVVFHAYPRVPLSRATDGINWAGVTLGGTWTNAAWRHLAGTYPGTDTDGATADFDIVGSGFSVWSGQSQSGGKVDVYVDGGFVTTVDTYANLATPAYAEIGVHRLAYGRHHVTLKLNGANASAVAAGSRATERRLGLYSVSTSAYEEDARLSRIA